MGRDVGGTSPRQVVEPVAEGGSDWRIDIEDFSFFMTPCNLVRHKVITSCC